MGARHVERLRPVLLEAITGVPASFPQSALAARVSAGARGERLGAR